MDMDLMDLDDFDAEDEEIGEGEQQNRMFIIAVGIMSAILLIGILAFCGWVLIVGGYIGGRTADVADADATATAAALAVIAPPDEPTPVIVEDPTVEPTLPTATPTPTVEPIPTPTEEPQIPEEETPDETEPVTPAAVGAMTPTPGPRPLATPVTGVAQPPEPTMTETGIGAFTAVIIAAGLLILLFTARRLRAAR